MKRLLIVVVFLATVMPAIGQEIEYRRNYYTQQYDMILKYSTILTNIIDSVNYILQHDTTGVLGPDSTFFLFSNMFSQSGWYKPGDTVINDTSQWQITVGVGTGGDFSYDFSYDFFVHTPSIDTIYNKGDMIVKFTNDAVFADRLYILNPIPYSSPTLPAFVVLGPGDEIVRTVTHTYLSNSIYSVYKTEVQEDTKDTFTPGFTLTATTVVMVNGIPLKDDQWSGEGTTTLTLTPAITKFDYLIVWK